MTNQLAQQLWNNAVHIGNQYQKDLTGVISPYQMLKRYTQKLTEINCNTLNTVTEHQRITELKNYLNYIQDVPNNQIAMTFLYNWVLIDIPIQKTLTQIPKTVIDIKLIKPDYPVSQVKDMVHDVDVAIDKYRMWCYQTDNLIENQQPLPQQSNHEFIYRCWDHSLLHKPL